MLDIISDTMFIICAPLSVMCFVLILKTLGRIVDTLYRMDLDVED